MSWPQARNVLQNLELTKFCDFNLRNMIHHWKQRNTIEVRILPVSLDYQEIMGWTSLFEAILTRACEEEIFTVEEDEAPGIESLLRHLGDL